MPQKCVFRAGEDLSDIFGPTVTQDTETVDSSSDGHTASANPSQAASDTPAEASNTSNVRPANAHQRSEGGQTTRHDAEASITRPDDSQWPTNRAGTHTDVDATKPEGEAASGNINGNVNVNQAARASSGFVAGGAADDPEDLETVARNALAALDNTSTNLPDSSASTLEP